MNSKNESNQSDPTLWAIGALFIGIVVYTHQNELLEVVGTVIGLVLGALTLFYFVAVPVYFLRKKAPPVPTPMVVTKEPKPAKKKEPVVASPATKLSPEAVKNLQLIHDRLCKEEQQKGLLNSQLHAANDLDQEDRYFLSHEGYEEKEFVPFGKTRREQFFIQKQKQSLQHTFVLYSLLQLLRDRQITARVAPDCTLLITHTKQTYAVCVVTQEDHARHSYLYTTANRLSRVCSGGWWFLTTSSAYQRSFTRYGQTLTRNDIQHWIAETFPSQHPLPHNTTHSKHSKPRYT